MSTVGREQHRRLDTAAAEAQARDGGDDGQADIARPRRWQGEPRPRGAPPVRHRPRVLLVQLAVRTSAQGRSYPTGWLGRAKLVAFAGEPDKFGNATWDVYASEPDPRPSDPE